MSTLKNVVLKDYTEKKDQLMRSINALSDDEKAIAEESIKRLEALIAEAEGVEEESKLSEILDTFRAEVDEKIKAIAEKLTEKTEMEMENNNQNYLESANALHDFANALRSGVNFQQNWKQSLNSNGVSIASDYAEAYLPTYVKGKIEDAFSRKFAWLNDLKWVNAKHYAIRTMSTAQSEDNVRARGHKMDETKSANTWTMTAVELIPKAIYSLTTIANETIFNDDAGLVDYVIDTMTTQMQYEMARAILVGDGRTDSTTHPHIASIVSVASHTSTDAFVTAMQRNTSNELLDELRQMCDAVNTEEGEDVYLFMNKADVATLCRVVFGTGSTPQYVPIETLAAQLGVAKIITTDVMNNSTAEAVRFVALAPSKYVMCGDRNVRFDTWEDYKANEKGYRLEQFVAGGVEGCKSASFMINPNA